MTERPALPFGDPEPAAPAQPVRRVLSVSELTARVRVLLESKYAEVWIEGEISNARVWKTGHLYFTLKDEGAQLRAVMFRSALRYQRFRPEDGQHVIARGRLSVYEPKGEYQIVCEHLEPQGVGALQLAFEQLRRRLDQEGLFDTGRKRPLPPLPRKIGVVTSLDGAALRDIINVLSRRHPNVHVVISPTRVQGERAAEEIVRALRLVCAVPGVDVVIVGRGGGSVEDLWAFNEEPVARAIAGATAPVISAVGHETDFTISDFVADLRAPTPSAAAELVVAGKDEIAARIRNLEQRLRAAARDGLQRRRATVHALQTRPGLAGWPTRVAVRGRQVGELTHRLSRAARVGASRRERRLHELRLRLEALDLGRRIDGIRARLRAARDGMAVALRDVQQAREARLRVAAGRLETLSPLGVLARGYAVCWNAERSAIIRDAAKVTAGEEVHVTLHSGALDCTVTRVE
ncbi:MAG: exodeoxyribonuclease VII large subunit [Acidobacteria bacterium]|nr:exodeoxyribonuclease VII large subunit [Acidobacteriota bacterium]